MQLHKAKVSIFLQSGQSLEQNNLNQRRFWKKRRRDFEIKEMERIWRDYPMYQIKSLDLKTYDQMGSNRIDRNVNRNPEFP